jgi:hypothetical protein
MKKLSFFLSAILLGGSMAAQAEALFTLKGTAMDTRYANQSELRMSVLGWNEPGQEQAVVEAWRKYETDGDADAFAATLEEQPTRGYLFSKAATGYSIKYAWQDPNARDKRMVFMVTPGLKTRNPYMWEHPNLNAKAFSLIEIRGTDNDLDMKTSLEAPIELADGDILQLQGFDGADLFASMADSTPYYLKSDS